MATASKPYVVEMPSGLTLAWNGVFGGHSIVEAKRRDCAFRRSEETHSERYPTLSTIQLDSPIPLLTRMQPGSLSVSSGR